MGAWGTGILSDDTVHDVHADYIDLFNRGNSPEAIRKRLLMTYAEAVADPYEGPLVWIGIAKAQWDCSQLEPLVLSKVREIVTGGLGLDRWREQGEPQGERLREWRKIERLFEGRKIVLGQFLSKLETPNPRPRKARKATKRKPVFQPGDCLAVRLRDDDWGAILVLMRETESTDLYKETYGTNLIVAMRYKKPEMPTLAVFEKRAYLYLNHHLWKNHLELCYVTARGFRKVKDRFVRVGAVALRPTDFQTGKMYSSWSNSLDQMYLQDRWDRGFRD